MNSSKNPASGRIVGDFNAKTMSLQDIVDTFISPPSFSKLTVNNHTLVLGARGSGKTTLLKVLSFQALRFSEAEQNRWMSDLDFTGIYVPADAIWESMFSSMKNSKIDDNLSSLLMQSVFTTNVCTSVAQTVHDCLKNKGLRCLKIDQVRSRSVVREIAELWGLSILADSFLALQYALSLRGLELQKMATLLSYGLMTNEEVQKALPYLGASVFDLVAIALKIVNEAANRPDYKWALLFDEFEIAPDEIKKQIFARMRAGGDHQHVLFKISLAPCSAHVSEDDWPNWTTALEKNDYEKMTLWYDKKQDAVEFCRSICLNVFKKQPKLDGKDPKVVFGSSPYLEDDLEESVDQENKWKKDFAALKGKNTSFASYLERNHIDISDLCKSSKDAKKRPDFIRKIAPIVSFRNAYTDKNGTTRSWRQPFITPYAGWESIAAISEGNPRWLMRILTDLLNSEKFIANNSNVLISRAKQGRSLFNISQSFYNILSNTPMTQFYDSLKTSQSIITILDKIGEYFKKELLFDNFKPSPVLAFVVHGDIDSDTEHCLRIAMNHGALVCSDKPDHFAGYATLKRKKIRLSYLLSPYFSLLVRKGADVKLSKILNLSQPKVQSTNQKKEKAPLKQNNQLDFFSSLEENP